MIPCIITVIDQCHHKSLNFVIPVSEKILKINFQGDVFDFVLNEREDILII